MMIYHFPKRVHIMLLTFSILFMYINRLIHVREWLLWSITSTLVTIKHWVAGVVFCYFCFYKNMHTYFNWICWYMNTFYVFPLSSTVRYFSSNAFVQIGIFDLSCSTGLIMTFSKDFVSYEISLHVCGFFNGISERIFYKDTAGTNACLVLQYRYSKLSIMIQSQRPVICYEWHIGTLCKQIGQITACWWWNIKLF